MSVVVGLEEVGPCQKKLTIEVPRPAVEAEIGRVTQEFARKVQVPGFRQGKVPIPMVQRRFLPQIERQVIERLVPRYLRQAQAEKNLEPLLPPDVNLDSLQLIAGAAMTFVAEIETPPELTTMQLDPFELPEENTAASPEETAEALRDMQRRHGSWKTVDRPAARGDRVSGQMRDVTPDALLTDEIPLELELDGERVDDALLLALTGLAAGQSTEVTRRLGEGEKARDAQFAVRLTAVEERELPPLDDAFAEKVGKFADLAALESAVASELSAMKKNDLRRRQERALLEQLRQRHPLALPPRVVDQEVQHMLREYAETLAAQGVDFMKVELDWQKMSEDIRPQAERRVHARLLLDAVARVQKIKLDETHFEAFLGHLAAEQGQSTLALRHKLSETGRLESLRAELLRSQTLRQLLGEKPHPPATPAAAGAIEPETAVG